MKRKYFVEFWRDTLYQTVIEAEDTDEVVKKIEEKNYSIKDIKPVEWKDDVWTVQVTDITDTEEE